MFIRGNNYGISFGYFGHTFPGSTIGEELDKEGVTVLNIECTGGFTAVFSRELTNQDTWSSGRPVAKD